MGRILRLRQPVVGERSIVAELPASGEQLVDVGLRAAPHHADEIDVPGAHVDAGNLAVVAEDLEASGLAERVELGEAELEILAADLEDGRGWVPVVRNEPVRR